jgi:Zn-dependent protease
MFSSLSGLEIVFVLVSLILSMTIHEAMHAFTAHWLGDTTAQEQGRLSLNPLKHIDLLTTILLPLLLIISHVPPFFAAKPVPFNPERVKYGEYGAALVGVAGPLTNLGLAIIAALVIRIGAHSLSQTVGDAVLIFAEVNVSFFVFNMIPFPPLDGSRLLYAFAPEPLQEIMQSIERLGFTAILIFMFVVISFFSPIITHISVSILNFLLGY